MALEANISPRQCLTNQVTGEILACKECATGRRVKKAHPEIKISLSHKYSWGNPTMWKSA